MQTPVLEDRSKPAPKKYDVQAKAVALSATFGTIIIGLLVFIVDKTFDRINATSAAVAELQINQATQAAELDEMRTFVERIELYILGTRKDDSFKWPDGP